MALDDIASDPAGVAGHKGIWHPRRLLQFGERDILQILCRDGKARVLQMRDPVVTASTGGRLEDFDCLQLLGKCLGGQNTEADQTGAPDRTWRRVRVIGFLQ